MIREAELYEEPGFWRRLGRSRFTRGAAVAVALTASGFAAAQIIPSITKDKVIASGNGNSIMYVTNPGRVHSGESCPINITINSDPFNHTVFVVGGRNGSAELGDPAVKNLFGNRPENPYLPNLLGAVKPEGGAPLDDVSEWTGLGGEIVEGYLKVTAQMPGWVRSAGYRIARGVARHRGDIMPDGALVTVPVTFYKDDTLKAYAIVNPIDGRDIVLEASVPIDVIEDSQAAQQANAGQAGDGWAGIGRLATIDADGFIYPNGVERGEDGGFAYDFADPKQVVLASFEARQNEDAELIRKVYLSEERANSIIEDFNKSPIGETSSQGNRTGKFRFVAVEKVARPKKSDLGLYEKTGHPSDQVRIIVSTREGVDVVSFYGYETDPHESYAQSHGELARVYGLVFPPLIDRLPTSEKEVRDLVRSAMGDMARRGGDRNGYRVADSVATSIRLLDNRRHGGVQAFLFKPREAVEREITAAYPPGSMVAQQHLSALGENNYSGFGSDGAYWPLDLNLAKVNGRWYIL